MALELALHFLQIGNMIIKLKQVLILTLTISCSSCFYKTKTESVNFEMCFQSNFMIGSAKLKNSELDSAKYYFELAIACDDNKCAYANNVALEYFNHSHYDQAELLFKKARKICNENCDFLFNHALNLTFLDSTDAALAEVRRCIDLDENNCRCREVRAILNLGLGDTLAAEQDLKHIQVNSCSLIFNQLQILANKDSLR